MKTTEHVRLLKLQIGGLQKDYREGYKRGEKDRKLGCDVGRGSPDWLGQTDAWREGYEDGHSEESG